MFPDHPHDICTVEPVSDQDKAVDSSPATLDFEEAALTRGWRELSAGPGSAPGAATSVRADGQALTPGRDTGIRFWVPTPKPSTPDLRQRGTTVGALTSSWGPGVPGHRSMSRPPRLETVRGSSKQRPP